MNELDSESTRDAVGFVLAGGRSTRMGEDKSLVRFAGQPLVAHALGALRGAGLATSLVGAASTFDTFAPIIPDQEPWLGPLGGICAALASTSAAWAVFLPVDMPLLPVSLLDFLIRSAIIAGGTVTVPSVNGFAQTFPVVLSRRVLPTLEADLKAGRRGCFSAFQAAAADLARPMAVLPVEMAVQSGHVAHPEGLASSRWFLNINAAEELRRAHEYSHPSYRVS